MPCSTFALLAGLKFLYGPGGTLSPEPLIGVWVVFIPPYVKKQSFREAYTFLNQCVRIGSQPLEEERVLFLHSSTESNAIPYLQPFPLWLDYATKGLFKEVPNHAPLHCFQAFHLHRIVAVAPKQITGLAPYVYTPCCKGYDPFLEPNVPVAIPESSVKWTQCNIRVTEPSDTHWSLLWDKTFDAHLAQVKQDRANKEAPTPKGRGVKHKNSASKGDFTTQAKKLLTTAKSKTSALQMLMTEAGIGEDERGDPELADLAGGWLDTPPPADVKEDVDELLGSICSFQLQALNEMGSVRMVDLALAEGFSAKFL